MTVLDVLEWPDKILETKAEPVTTFDEDLKKFVSDMHATMDDRKGIGLAANQVGVLKRVLVMGIPWVESTEPGEEQEEKKWWHNQRFTIINPEITRREGKTKYMEGCLSFPEMYDYVNRAAEVWVSYQDESGEKKEIHADGLLSICLQHEMDHLDGVVFFSRMSRLKAGMIKKKMLKRAEVRRIQSSGEKS